MIVGYLPDNRMGLHAMPKPADKDAKDGDLRAILSGISRAARGGRRSHRAYGYEWHFPDDCLSLKVSCRVGSVRLGETA